MITTESSAGDATTTGHNTDQISAERREMFQRFLAAWATDVLALRRHGLDRPCVRDAWAPAAPMRRAA